MTISPTRRTVLVAYASKMGGTKGIAGSIADELSRGGIDVTLLDAASVESVDRFDAVVLGSCLYLGRWHPATVAVLRLLDTRSEKLGSLPVWLFQSGPCGDGALTEQVASPRRVRRYADRLGAEHPTTFGGRLDPALTHGFMARRMATGALAGDYRDFAEIRHWAAHIADRLTKANTPSM